MKLHWKIFLSALAALAVAILSGWLYLENTLRPRITGQMMALLRAQMDLAAPLIENQAARGNSPEDLQSLVTSLAHRGTARITVLTAGGEILADSSVHQTKLAEITPQLGQPEVARAIESGEGADIRHSDSLDADLLLLARRVSLGGSTAIVRLAYSLSAAEEAVIQARQALGRGALLGFLLAAALSIFLSRRISAPFEDLAQMARLTADGDLAAAARAPSTAEAGEVARSFVNVTGKLRETLGRLEREHAQAQRILSAVQEGIVLLDDYGSAVTGNNAFSTLFDLPPLSAQWDMERVLPKEVLERALASLAGGEVYFHAEFPLQNAGAALRIEMGAAPVMEGKMRVGTVLVFRDVTRARRLEEVRRDFVTNVSHELRTPLAAAQAAAETLSGEFPEGDPRGRFAFSILSNTRRLSALVDNLLDLARLERTDFVLRKERGDLATALARCAENFRPRYESAGVKLSFEANPASQPASFDVQLVDQVLSNLLENALRHSGGEVSIRCSEDEGYWKTDVLDSGPGVASEHLGRIFERFYRADRGRSREKGGTGLGLAIAKHIVERHGGRIGAENRPEGGARFWFVLPQNG